MAYYGFVPYEVPDKLTVTKPAMFNNFVGSIPKHFKAIQGYRHFVVVVQLPEHAFNGPYNFKLFHKSSDQEGGESIYVGSVVVFARPDYSNCEACSRRRNAGSVVRGIIPLTPETVDKIISSQGDLNRTGVEDAELTGKMKSVFHAVLANPNGDELAHTGVSGDGDGGGEVEEPQLDRHLAPVKVTLVSSGGAVLKDGLTVGAGNGPACYFDPILPVSSLIQLFSF